MGIEDKIISAYKAFNGPDQEELFNESKKLDKKINNNSPLQNSITKLLKKIENSNTSEERYILKEQLEELEKFNILYKNNIKGNLTKTTKKEIKSLLLGLENQINSKENIIDDDYKKFQNIIQSENEKLEDTIDIISANTIRDNIENNINILGIKESLPTEQYQNFFDIATITYIDILEEIENKGEKFSKNQIDFLIKNKGLYLDSKGIHKYIIKLIKRLKNKDLNFDFEIKLKKINYNKSIIINLKKYKDKIENDIKIKKLKEQKEEEKRKLEIEQKNYVLNEATDLIIRHEGFAPISKWDKRQYSRGYGTKAPGKGLEISKTQAKKELKKKILKTKKYVEKYFPNINKNQKVALISFFYNNGTSSKGKENLIWRLKHLNKNVKGLGTIKPTSIANMIVQYTKSGGKDLKGLIARREEEKEYFLKND